jgi:hypothetical protein
MEFMTKKIILIFFFFAMSLKTFPKKKTISKSGEVFFPKKWILVILPNYQKKKN